MAGHKYTWCRYVFFIVILMTLAFTHSSTFRDFFIEKEDEKSLNKVKVSSLSTFMENWFSQSQSNYFPLQKTSGSSYLNNFTIYLLILAISTLIHFAVEIYLSQSNEEQVMCKLKLESSDVTGKSHMFLHRLLSMLTIRFDKEDTFSIFGSGCSLLCDFKWIWMDSTLVDSPPSWMRKYIVYPAFQLLASYRNLTGLEANQNSPSFIELSEAGFGYTGEGSLVRCSECGKNLEISSITEKPDDSKYHLPGCKFAKAEKTIINANASGSQSSAVEEDNCARLDSQDEGFNEGTETDAAPHTSQASLNHHLQSSTHRGKQSEGSLAQTLQRDSHNENNIQSFEAQPSVLARSSPSLIVTSAAQQSENVPGDSSIDRLNSGESQEAKASNLPGHTSNSHYQTLNSDSNHQNTRPFSSYSALSDSSGYQSSASDDQNTASATAESKNAEASGIYTQYSKGHPDEGFYDQEAVACEDMAYDTKSKNLPSVLQTQCNKNPGHFSYFLVSNIGLEHLPASVRCPDVLKLLRTASFLIVRIVVKGTSVHRPVRNDKKYHVGTGNCLIDHNKAQTSEYEPSGKLNSLLKYFHHGNKKTGEIYIETSRHIVFDDIEAENATVEFFLDRQDGKNVEIVKGVEVRHSQIPGDYRSVLVCKTNNLGLVEKLNNYREEFYRLARNMPQTVHEALTNKIFIIGHPHGREKVLSYGESVVIKYVLTSNKTSGKAVLSMEKVNNQQQLPQDISSVRKVLLYTADTCEGSSGSPVVTFKSVPGGVELDLWIHNGFDKKHELSASAMKSLSAEDIVNHGKPTRSRRSEVNQNAGDGLSSFTAVVQGPVFTVIGRPAHPSYTAYDKRLDSFANWAYEHIQLKEQLTSAGFFYAGYADCARCFQCGLGLRTWKAGDDVYREHYKHKPTCQFLLMQLRVKGITDPERQLLQAPAIRTSNTEPITAAVPCQSQGQETTSSVSQKATLSICDTTAPVSQKTAPNVCDTSGVKTLCKEMVHGIAPQAQVATVAYTFTQNGSNPNAGQVLKKLRLLERENQILEKRLTCKVCCQRPIKDLFLPCGELYACTECSQLLTHCPSCGKQIEATVTTYFT